LAKPSNEPEQKQAEQSANTQQTTTQPEAADENEAKNLTAPQKNAVRSAKQYLSMAGFSRKGLIQQLSSDAGEGYKASDATVAVDSLKVDWNQEAARSAKQYLSIQGFSCKALISQLSSSAGDNYTTSQATYGAHQAGACE
jgi:transposase